MGPVPCRIAYPGIAAAAMVAVGLSVAVGVFLHKRSRAAVRGSAASGAAKAAPPPPPPDAVGAVTSDVFTSAVPSLPEYTIPPSERGSAAAPDGSGDRRAAATPDAEHAAVFMGSLAVAGTADMDIVFDDWSDGGAPDALSVAPTAHSDPLDVASAHGSDSEV